MPISKDELRSADVREIMKKPPHVLIAWGNIFIVLLLVVGLFLIDRFTLSEKIAIPFEIVKVDNSKTILGHSNCTLFIGDIDVPDTTQQHIVTITLNGYPFNKSDVIKAAVDTIVKENGGYFMFVKFLRSENQGRIQNENNLKPGVRGTVTIERRNVTLFEEIKKRIFN